jgi:hypothetical protein
MILLIQFRQVTSINKRLAPNLRRLTIAWNGVITLKSFTDIFERDILFSLDKFTLFAIIDSADFLRNLLSMLSSQCLYSFNVVWFMEITVSLSEASQILSDTFQQLKASVPIELELTIEQIWYSMRARTISMMNKCLDVDSYLYKKTVFGYE